MIGLQSKLLLGLGAGGVLLLGLVGWRVNDKAFDRGVAKERATWQAAARELKELRQRRADWSAARLAERLDALNTTTSKEIIHVQTRFVDRPDGPCLDADVVRELEAARARIRTPSPSPGSNAMPAGAGAAAAGDKKGDGNMGAAK